MPIDAELLRTSLNALSHEALVEIVVHQSERIAELERRVAALAARIEDEPPRPSAPFRIDDAKRQSSPKRPGRRKGHPGARRQARPITERVEVALDACPHCGAGVEDQRPVRQIVEELPDLAVRVVEVTTWAGRCRACGPVRSRHPLAVSTAEGAAGVMLGPRALALVARLRTEWHLTTRRTCRLLDEVFGLRVTPGGVAQALARVAERVRPDYEALIARVRESEVVHSDETSWYVGSPTGSSLWVFATPRATLYRVVARRTRAALVEVIGERYEGVLVSDCLSIYDGASARQQKCYAHHLRAVGKARERHPGGGSAYLDEVSRMLKAALGVRGAKAELEASGAWRRVRKKLDDWAQGLLEVGRGQAEEEAVRRRLAKQREHLFTFLDEEGVEATNNLAERQLRPAVIARKVSCGNRTWAGARAWETLASLAATCAQTGSSFDDLLQTRLRVPPPSTAR